MGSSARCGESDLGKLLADTSGYAAGSEWSTPTETSDTSGSYVKTDALLDGGADETKELLGILTRRRSSKVANGLTRMSSLKPRRSATRKGIGGADRKKKLKKLRSNKLVGPDSSSSRGQGSLDHDQRSSSPNEADALPNYLKVTRSSDVKKMNSQPSPNKSDCSISSSDGEGTAEHILKPRTARNKPVMAFRRTASLRPVRILAKIPSLKPTRASTRKCSDRSEVSDSSVHRATCSSAIKGSKLPAQVENPQAGDVSEKISAMKVCPYSYCSLYGHRHAAPTLKRLKSARRRVKSQNGKKLDDPSRSSEKGVGRKSSHDDEKADKELMEERNSRKDVGSNADDGQDRVEEVAGVGAKERKEQSGTADSPMAGEENPCQASNSSWEDKHCREPPAMSEKAHVQRESEQEILESTDAKKKEKGKSEENPDTGKVQFVSTGTQTDLELEDLWNDNSAAAHIASDCHEETSETFQETDDGKPHLPNKLSHGDSTLENEQSNPSGTAAIGIEEEEARAGASVFPAEDLISAHGELEEKLESPDVPNKEALPDSREEPTSVDEKHDSPEALTDSLSGSTEEPILACKMMDENPDSPGGSEADSNSDDSFKSSFGRRKFNRLWFLIYQHMVSDVAENGGMESPVYRDTKEEQVVSAKLPPGLGRDPEVASHDEGAPQEELQQSDAIKLLQEAIVKILEQSQDQCSIRKSSANNDNFNDLETGGDHSANSKSEKEPDPEEEKPEAPEVPKIEEKREVNEGGRPNQLASKRWSNLKKYILMKRFIKAMEKTKNFSRRIQRLSSSEVYSEQEKVNLRHQQIGERKNADGWMLDHALQKVISKLDPAQKRRVALLVEAFETVNPVQRGKPCVSMSASSPSNVNHSAARETSLVQTEEKIVSGKLNSTELLTGERPSASDECHKVREKLGDPSVDGERDQKGIENYVASPTEQGSRHIFISEQSGEVDHSILPQVSMDRDKTENRDQSDGPAVGRVQDIQREEIKAPNSRLESGNDGMSRKGLLDSDISRMYVPDDPVESTVVEASISFSVYDELKDPSVARETDDGDMKSMRTDVVTESMGEDDEALAERGEIPGSPDPEECRAVSVTDVVDDLQPEKKKYTGLWNLIYKHMASGLATEQGREPLDPPDDGNGNEDEVNEVEESRSDNMDMPGSGPDSLRAQQDLLIEKKTDSEDMKICKMEAVRLVMKAIDEILLEYDGRAPHDRSNASDGVPEQESEEKSGSSYSETSLPAPTDSTKDSSLQFGKEKENKPPLDTEIQLKPEKAAQQEERTDSQDANKSNLRSVKNWNNVRKMILLNRFVKSLEKVRDIKPRERRHLPLDPDMEPEKVNLKRQDMDERKGAEEYLLDYALQQAVSRLTPARKRKVHLLVEAFETVTPPLRK